jgi:CTP-dependent riboflavin kinase
MNNNEPTIILVGTARLSDHQSQRTVGKFNKLINENAATFRRHFKTDLFAGSLNIDVPLPATLQQDLDAGKYEPSFVIPKTELVGMPSYIGDGQAWRARLTIQKTSACIPCWVFRRIDSKVSKGVLEIVATEKLRTTYGLEHGDAVEIALFIGSQVDVSSEQ